MLYLLSFLLFFPHAQPSHWLELHRQSNKELLYYGIPGDKNQSMIKRVFSVKSGVPGEKPTPLPHLYGRNYWIVTDKIDAMENEETAPYFLSLDIPVSDDAPYGPVPYLECNGQCDWEVPGSFGLHGVSGMLEKLSQENSGSSGCVRHHDADITYLYNILDPKREEIRYYIIDI